MTHRKKLTIFLLAVATLFTFVLLIHPYRKNDSSLLSDHDSQCSYGIRSDITDVP